MKSIKNFIMLPFKKNILFMFFLFVIQCPYMVQFFVMNYRLYGVLLGVHCFLLSYLVTLLITLIKPKILRTIIQVILVVLTGVFFALNYYCINQFNSVLDEDYLMLILETNTREANEFLTSVLPISVVLGVGGMFIFFGILWLLSKRYNLGLREKWFLPVFALLLVLGLVHLMFRSIWTDGIINHVAHLVTAVPKYELPDESQLNNSHPTITFVQGDRRPDNVVVIIGESFSRNHSSMYGYEKNTNPNLSRLRDSDLLFTFDSIESPDINTCPSIKYMLSLYSKDDSVENGKKWYEYSNLIEMMHACGYDSYWYSNQARAGIFNSVARVFAQACKHVSFYQMEGPEGNNKILDQVLVDSSYRAMNEVTNTRRFVVYHMMGSHFEYSRRYPEDFEHFTENDYADKIEGQRHIRATFDNSILYNDYVVSELIKIFKEQEAIVIYIPDHGQDIFDSSPDYYMHGKRHDKVSYAYGVSIPFMVYASSLFQQRHPKVMERIKARQQHPKQWNTDDLPYFIMNIIGVDTVNGEPVKLHSIL